MQVKIFPEQLELMLQNGDFNIIHQSKNLIEATKTFDNGIVRMRMKRENQQYSLKESYHWHVGFHFERGIRPQRYFDSKKVHNFAENYVTPYVLG